MNKNTNILFVVSKSTGLTSLKSFLEQRNALNVSVLVLDDRSDIRSCFEQIISICKKYNIDPSVAKSKNCLSSIILSQRPDLVFVCGWYWIIPDEILAQIPLGVLGIHNSLLPKYRGHAPLVWSMINGDTEVGASLFKIEPGMDTGDVFYQWKIKPEGRYLSDVLQSLEALIETTFGDILLKVLNGNLPGTKQDTNQISFSAKRREEDGLINWEEPAEKTVFKIKALSSPYPNAFTFINNNKVSLLKAEIFNYPTFGEPGQVIFCDQSCAVIKCGSKQAIRITEAVDLKGQNSIQKLFSKLSSPPKFFELYK